MASGGGGSESADKLGAKGKTIAGDVESDEAPTFLLALGGYKPLPGVLRFVIVVDPVENIRNYALVPFPVTYEEAQEAAIETLGELMIDPKPANVELRGIMRGRDGKWISTFIRPRDWSVIVEASFCEVLVVDKLALITEELKKDTLSPGQDGLEESFLHGHLWITAGEKIGGSMEWTKVHRAVYSDNRTGQEGKPVTPWINRPRSYQEALDLVNQLMTKPEAKIRVKLDSSPGANRMSFGPVKLPEPSETNRFPVKFYTFATLDDTTSAWRPFPEAAYTHEKVWRKIVPVPGEKLGVAVHF